MVWLYALWIHIKHCLQEILLYLPIRCHITAWVNEIKPDYQCVALKSKHFFFFFFCEQNPEAYQYTSYYDMTPQQALANQYGDGYVWNEMKPIRLLIQTEYFYRKLTKISINNKYKFYLKARSFTGFFLKRSINCCLFRLLGYLHFAPDLKRK